MFIPCVGARAITTYFIVRKTSNTPVTDKNNLPSKTPTTSHDTTGTSHDLHDSTYDSQLVIEDPVTYFAKNRDGPIKFVYLNKVHINCDDKL